MTINQYISEIRVNLPKDYPNIDDRTLLKLLNEFRSVYIKNTLNQNDAFVPREFMQKVLGLEMDIVSQKETPFITDNSRILRSKIKIPERVNLTHRELVYRIWDSKILGEDFNFINPEQAKYAGNGKMNVKEVFAFFYDDYLYIKLKRENPNINLINFVSIELILENPEDMIPLEYADYFDFKDYDYPMTTVAWSYVKSSILQNGLQVINSTENE